MASAPVSQGEQIKQTMKTNKTKAQAKLTSPTTTTVASDFREGSKMVNISSDDVVQVLMKGTQPLGSGAPATRVPEPKRT